MSSVNTPNPFQKIDAEAQNIDKLTKDIPKNYDNCVVATVKDETGKVLEVHVQHGNWLTRTFTKIGWLFKYGTSVQFGRKAVIKDLTPHLKAMTNELKVSKNHLNMSGIQHDLEKIKASIEGVQKVKGLFADFDQNTNSECAELMNDLFNLEALNEDFNALKNKKNNENVAKINRYVNPDGSIQQLLREDYIKVGLEVLSFQPNGSEEDLTGEEEVKRLNMLSQIAYNIETAKENLAIEGEQNILLDIRNIIDPSDIVKELQAKLEAKAPYVEEMKNLFKETKIEEYITALKNLSDGAVEAFPSKIQEITERIKLASKNLIDARKSSIYPKGVIENDYNADNAIALIKQLDKVIDSIEDSDKFNLPQIKSTLVSEKEKLVQDLKKYLLNEISAFTKEIDTKIKELKSRNLANDTEMEDVGKEIGALNGKLNTEKDSLKAFLANFNPIIPVAEANGEEKKVVLFLKELLSLSQKRMITHQEMEKLKNDAMKWNIPISEDHQWEDILSGDPIIKKIEELLEKTDQEIKNNTSDGIQKLHNQEAKLEGLKGELNKEIVSQEKPFQDIKKAFLIAERVTGKNERFFIDNKSTIIKVANYNNIFSNPKVAADFITSFKEEMKGTNLLTQIEGSFFEQMTPEDQAIEIMDGVIKYKEEILNRQDQILKEMEEVQYNIQYETSKHNASLSLPHVQKQRQNLQAWQLMKGQIQKIRDLGKGIVQLREKEKIFDKNSKVSISVVTELKKLEKKANSLIELNFGTVSDHISQLDNVLASVKLFRQN